jgi:trehalose 6-phosphate phosphatase
MAQPTPPTAIDLATTAFFFDFDGTLAGIVEDPQAVSVEPRVLEALRAMQEATTGAVAVISGRSIEQLDRMLHPLRLPAAGVHGLERRDAAGSVSRVEIDEQELARLRERIAEFVRGYPGLLAEHKPGSVALHYRKRPDLASSCRILAAQLASENDHIRVVRGKMVVEMKLAGRTKADGIADFMAEPPLAGRPPRLSRE